MKFIKCLLIASLSIVSMAACSSTGDEMKDLPSLPDEPEVEDPTPVPGSTDKIVVGYVTSWSRHEVHPEYVTHINYAFGHVGEDFKSVGIADEGRFKQVIALKKNAPHLKILLSIGGWGSGRFSEMAANDEWRMSFAKDCKRVVDQYGIDGIDIDWEYPTSSAADISSSPDDTKNYTLLMRDIRKAIGKDKLLTLATVCSAEYIDFPAIMPYVDFVNTMFYDMGNPPSHNAPLYKSDLSGWYNCDDGVKAHLAKGVPAEKLVFGMPFYGHCLPEMNNGSNFIDFKDIKVTSGYKDNWDNDAKVPYITDKNGKMVICYDNAKSIGMKCDYILEHGLHGAMFWDDAGDNSNQTLHKVIAEKLFAK